MAHLWHSHDTCPPPLSARLPSPGPRISGAWTGGNVGGDPQPGLCLPNSLPIGCKCGAESLRSGISGWPRLAELLSSGIPVGRRDSAGCSGHSFFPGVCPHQKETHPLPSLGRFHAPPPGPRPLSTTPSPSHPPSTTPHPSIQIRVGVSLFGSSLRQLDCTSSRIRRQDGPGLRLFLIFLLFAPLPPLLLGPSVSRYPCLCKKFLPLLVRPPHVERRKLSSSLFYVGLFYDGLFYDAEMAGPTMACSTMRKWLWDAWRWRAWSGSPFTSRPLDPGPPVRGKGSEGAVECGSNQDTCTHTD